MRTFELFAKNTKDGGFEKYCQAFLSKLGYECELTKESVDGGIDIIANKDGISIGFQCKNKGRNIGSPIVRETEGARIAMGLDKGAILTTATFTKEAKETAEKLGIDLYNWSDIAKLTADMEFEDTEEDRKLLTESVVFEHNEKVYEQLEKHLTEDNKAIVVIGTGLGKTTTALEYCYRHSCRGLVIAPKKIICEDWEQNDCIDAMTFQSFIVQYNDIDYDRYGVVIIDEVHHSGASKWGAGVQHIINNGNKVIGLTATPDRLDGVDIVKHLFGGNLCQGLDVLDGINQGILHPFNYIGAYYDAEKVCQAIKDKYGDKLSVELTGKLDIALNNTPTLKEIIVSNMPDGKRKGVIFVEKIEDMDEGISLIKEIYPNVEYRKLHSYLNSEELKDIKEWFQKADEGYLCAINMISEGIHYNNVNTLFMLRRTKSATIFEQQIGRVVTLAIKDDPNAIVYDLVNNSKTVQSFKIRVAESAHRVNERRKSVHSTDKMMPAYAESEPIVDEKSKQIIIKEYVSGIDQVLEAIKAFLDRKAWTDEEIEYLKNNIEILPLEDIAAFLNKTTGAVHSKAWKLGLIENNRIWFDSEITILKEKYSVLGGKVCELIPRHSNTACMAKAALLGLKYEKTNYWQPWEDSIIINEYPTLGNKIKNKLNNRHISDISTRAKKLGVKYENRGTWEEWEDEIIKEFFPSEGVMVYKRLTAYNRSKSACQHRARRLGVSFEKIQWTKEDDAILIQYYPKCGKKVASMLENHTEKACMARAAQLNLSAPNQNGSKKVRCVETGIVYESIKAASIAVGKNVHNALSKRPCKVAGYHWEFVEDSE